MDLFERLPAELRSMILELLASRSDVAAATQTTKVLEDGAIARRDVIRRLHLEKDLSGDLLQAAMAVILFPGPGSDETSISNHLDDWENGRFPNPFLDHDNNRDCIEKLDDLCGCLRLVITDYLSKATSARLPFAYRALPTWSHPSYTQMAAQRDLHRHHLNSFNINKLETAERCRVYSAFLHYEILSKVYGPLIAARPHVGFPPLAFMFDYSLFSNFTPISDRKLFGSIREYYITTHRAVLAQLENNPRLAFRQQPPQHMPEECEHAPRVGQYRFPPNPSARYVVARESYEFTDENGFAVLASGGFDTLVGVLTAQPATTRILYQELWLECDDNLDRLGPAWSKPRLDSNDPEFVNYSNRTQFWLLAGLVRLQRQRAWGVFRDDRFYPRSMGFITQQFRQGMMQGNSRTLPDYRLADEKASYAEIAYPRPHVWASLNRSRILREAWKRCERRGVCSWRIMTE